MRGEVTILVRDKDTEEILNTITKKNIITENLYFSMAGISGTAGLRFQVAVTSAVMGHAKECNLWPVTGSGVVSSTRSSDIVGVTTPTLIPKTNDLDAFIQYSGRWSAPSTGTTRLINCIGLVDTSTPMAYTQLDIPCVQLDNQVLDIYYRLYLPYDTEYFNFPSFMVNEGIKYRIMGGGGTYSTEMLRYHRTVPFPTLNVRSSDIDSIFPNTRTIHYTTFRQDSLGAVSSYGMRVYSTNMDFTYKVGNIISGVYTGSPSESSGPISNYCNFGNKFSKIQNCIGHGPESTNTLSNPWQDVDNLVSGTGKVYIEGDWQNRDTAPNPPLYHKVKLPEWNHVTITTSGAVGVSTYKYTSQKFFGNLTYNIPSAINSYCIHYLDGLEGSRNLANGEKTLLGNINDITVKQLSACCRYDETSIVVVRPESLILYSIAGSEYWRITGNFTGIHQLAVLNDVIWIACRNTGLWYVNPKLTLTPTKVDASASGINFDKCHGVAVGHNNTIWAVANNSLAKWDGTSWTKYDENSTHPFRFDTLAGGSATETWTNIEYIKVDPESTTNQMMIVRKVGASYFSTKLGVWWSTSTTSVNTGDEPSSSGLGRPRVHRSHINVLNGFWVIKRSGLFYRSNFGSTTFTSIFTLSNVPATMFTTASVNLVKDPAGNSLLIACYNYSGGLTGGTEYQTLSFGTIYTPEVQLINSSGTVTYNLTTTESGLVWGGMDESYVSNSGFGTETVSGYSGSYDLGHNILLDKGVMVLIGKSYTQNTLFTGIFNYGLNRTPHGGALRWLVRTEYGWNGSSWVEGNSNSRPTHLTAEPIMDGVTVRFTEGATGTSFVANDYYKYGLCEGLMKDNATRANLTIPFHFRKTFVDNTEISNNTVPAVTALPTGVIGAHASFISSGAYLNANSEPVFPGQNRRQYITGDKMLAGNFEISYDVTNLNDASMRDSAAFGVALYNGYWPDYGIVLAGGVMYACRGASISSSIRSNLTGLTSLTLKRVGGTLTISANGTVIHTYDGSALIKNNQRLFHTWMVKDVQGGASVTNVSTNTRAPRATIVSNGSDNAVFVGSSANGTGWFNPRFYGIDSYSPISVTIDGVAAPVLLDGTDPVPGSVSVSPWMGAFYFNSADQGKPITASFTYQVSGA